MVRDIVVADGTVAGEDCVDGAHCPLAKTLQTDVENAVRKLEGIKSVKVDTTSMTEKDWTS